MVATLDDLYITFKVDDVHKKRLINTKKRLVESGNVFDKDLQSRVNLMKRLVNGEATQIEKIKSVLNIIEWKAQLIKYDLINNQTDVLVHYKWNEEPSDKW